MKNQPLVSINIRTYNSARTLRDTLESIRSQSYKYKEVLVSDGGSTDETVLIAKSFRASVRFANKLGDARHQNFKNSKGAYVVSIDSDQILDRRLIEECVRMCQTGGYDALSIAEQSRIRKNTFLERIIAYDKWVIDQTSATDPIFGAACPRFFRKSMLASVKWPKALSIFDDTILYAKLLENGAKVGYLRTSYIRHYELTSWSALWRKFYRYGRGYMMALRELPLTVTTHSLPRTSYLSRPALSKPTYFFGLLLLYGVKATAAGTGMISSVIDQLFSSRTSS